MALGDDAVADGMALVNGNQTLARDIDDVENQTRDYIAQRNRSVRPIQYGGTGGNTAAAALSALGASPAGHNHDGRYITAGGTDAGDLAIAHGGGRAQLFAGGNFKGMIAYLADIPPAQDVSGKRNYDDGYFPGDLNSKNLYLRESFAATSGWTVAYINSDGRVSKGASSERYKKWIGNLDPEALGDIFPQLVRYQMRSQPDSPTDNAWHVGHIAERLAENPDQAPFVVHADIDGESKPDSIDFIALLLAQTAQLNQRLTRAVAENDVAFDYIDQLEQRIKALEGKATA